MKEAEHDHSAATKGYVYTKLPFVGGDMQGDTSMAGFKIRCLGPPEHQNDAAREIYVDEYFLKRDGSNWMRGPLHAGGF